jgi:hypothetical protein
MWRSPENDCAVARGHTLGVIGISLDAISDEEFRTYLRNLEGKTIDDTSTYSPILKDCSDVFFAQSTDDIAVASFADRTRFETGTPSIQQKVGRKGHTEALVSTCVSYQRRKEIDKYARYFLTMPYSIGHGADINFHDRCIAETQNIMIRISTICHAREAERDTPDRTRRFAYLMYQIVFKPPAYLLGIVMGTKIWALIARRIKKRLPRLYREANRIAGNVIALKYRTKQS